MSLAWDRRPGWQRGNRCTGERLCNAVLGLYAPFASCLPWKDTKKKGRKPPAVLSPTRATLPEALCLRHKQAFGGEEERRGGRKQGGGRGRIAQARGDQGRTREAGREVGKGGRQGKSPRPTEFPRPDLTRHLVWRHEGPPQRRQNRFHVPALAEHSPTREETRKERHATDAAGVWRGRKTRQGKTSTMRQNKKKQDVLMSLRIGGVSPSGHRGRE